jgi:hypothetical protein
MIARPIEPWAATLILSGVNRLDCALTTLGCIMMDLDDDPESGNASGVEAIRWLYEVLREEAHNIRHCVAMARDPQSCTPKAADAQRALEDAL